MSIANRALDPNFILSESTTSDATKPRSEYGKFKRAFDTAPERKWQIEVQQRLFEYAKMQTGWDSHGAAPVMWDASMFALNVLNDVMRPRTPIPQVVPTSVGGVQLEWHEKGIDLELHITAPYQCEVWFQDLNAPGTAPLELNLTSDFSALVNPISLLTQR